MIYRMAIGIAIIFPVVCGASELNSQAANFSNQSPTGPGDRLSTAAPAKVQKHENLESIAGQLTAQSGIRSSVSLEKIARQLTAQSGTRSYDSLDNIVKQLSEESSVQQFDGLASIARQFTAQPVAQQKVIPDETSMVQSGIWRLESLAETWVEAKNPQRPETQINAGTGQDENAKSELQMYDSRKLKIFLLFTVVLGAWGVNRFGRLRCPDCKTTSPILHRVEEVDSWLSPKVVIERRKSVRPRKTDFTKVRRIYICRACSKRWDTVSNVKK